VWLIQAAIAVSLRALSANPNYLVSKSKPYGNLVKLPSRRNNPGRIVSNAVSFY
jgi:hypothetical protein